MPPVNTTQARVNDPVLSKYAQGYTHPERVGHALFPDAPINTRGAKVLKFDKNSFKSYNTERAPGADYKTIQVGFATETVGLNQDALSGLVPIETSEEAAQVPGVDLGQEAVGEVLDIIHLNIERRQANLARDPNNYDATNKIVLAGAAQFSDAGSDPVAVIDAGREAIRRNIGMYPNTMVIGPEVFNALAAHAKIKEQFKYTSSESLTTEMLARFFKMKKVSVGTAITADDAGNTSDVWGKDIVMAYVPTTVKSVRQPSYGYNYTLKQNPNVQNPWFDRSKDSWLYPTKHESRSYITSMGAGYLIQNAVA